MRSTWKFYIYIYIPKCYFSRRQYGVSSNEMNKRKVHAVYFVENWISLRQHATVGGEAISASGGVAQTCVFWGDLPSCIIHIFPLQKNLAF